MINLLLNPKVWLVLLIASGAGLIVLQNAWLGQRDAQIKQLGAEVENLVIQKDAAEARLSAFSETVKLNQEVLNKLAESEKMIRDDIQKNIKIVQDNRLADLARQKPGLIEIRANRATERVFSELENNSNTFYEEYQK